MFVLQNVPMPASELSGLILTPLEIYSGTTKFDLTLELQETAEGIKGCFEYNRDLFESTTIAQMANLFQILLEGILVNPEQHLSDLLTLTV